MANDSQVQIGESPYDSGNSWQQYEPGKLFVGGLSWETKEESLRAYFQKYGQLSEVRVMVTADTGKPRGFGFVTYLDSKDAEKALADPNHTVDGAKVEAKRATKSGVNPPSGNKAGTKKVFLGGLSAESTKGTIMSALEKHGPITEAEIKMDPNTGRSRGFGFATFMTEEAASKAIAEHHASIDGRQVEVKPAENQKKGGRGGASQGYGRQQDASSMYYYGHQQPPAAYSYSSGHSGGYSGYPQWPGYDQYTQGASAGYYQGSSGAANYSSGYGNSYNASRTDSAGASYSTPQAQGYSYPQQQQQQQSYAGYSGYSGGGGGAARSQMPQQGYNGSFPPR